MKLQNKRALASRALKVGKDRIMFNPNNLASIKEAITKQDIRELHASGAIKIREPKGRRTIVKRRTRRRAGSVKKTVGNGKRKYMTITRKLRKHLATLKSKDQIKDEHYKGLRKEIKMSSFKSLSHMKERLVEVSK